MTLSQSGLQASANTVPDGPWLSLETSSVKWINLHELRCEKLTGANCLAIRYTRSLSRSSSSSSYLSSSSRVAGSVMLEAGFTFAAMKMLTS